MVNIFGALSAPLTARSNLMVTVTCDTLGPVLSLATYGQTCVTVCAFAAGWCILGFGVLRTCIVFTLFAALCPEDRIFHHGHITGFD